MSFENEQDIHEISNFDELENIHINIIRGVYSYGYEKPSPIQRRAIKPIIDRKDIKNLDRL